MCIRRYRVIVSRTYVYHPAGDVVGIYTVSDSLTALQLIDGRRRIITSKKAIGGADRHKSRCKAAIRASCDRQTTTCASEVVACNQSPVSAGHAHRETSDDILRVTPHRSRDLHR